MPPEASSSRPFLGPLNTEVTSFQSDNIPQFHVSVEISQGFANHNKESGIRKSIERGKLWNIFPRWERRILEAAHTFICSEV